MSSELSWGLRNAIERGYTLEQAGQSYIRAGYTESEVREAMNSITSGSGSIIASPSENNLKVPAQVNLAPPKPAQIFSAPAQKSQIIEQSKQLAPIMPPTASASQAYTPPVVQVNEDKISGGKRKKIIVILSVLLAVLVLMIAGIIIFSSQILNYISGVN